MNDDVWKNPDIEKWIKFVSCQFLKRVMLFCYLFAIFRCPLNMAGQMGQTGQLKPLTVRWRGPVATGQADGGLAVWRQRMRLALSK